MGDENFTLMDPLKSLKTCLPTPPLIQHFPLKVSINTGLRKGVARQFPKSLHSQNSMRDHLS